jgi:phenylacetate-CoA ligase
MAVRRLLHRHVLLPAFETLIKRRRTFAYMRELERSQWLSRAELDAAQFDALRRLLGHAWEHCPYYRGVWQEHGCDPSRLRGLQDFERWPTIDRATITANRADMRSRVPGMRLIAKATGGSSGEPLRFDLDTGSNDRRSAAAHRGYGWAGAELGAKLLYLWGAALGAQSRLHRWKDSLYHGLYRRKMLNSFELSESRVPQFLAQHNDYRPDVLVAYTNPLYQFARCLEQRGLRPYSPRSIIVGAEKLHEFQRAVIERVFGAPVFETYGSREFMLIGGECERHEGLHLTSEYLLVEVLDDDGTRTPAGREGNIVVTDLYNYGMPFIRYFTGDRAVAGWSRCSCGRGLPLMRPPLGRRLDILSTPDGRKVPGELFPHMLKDYPSVRRFQVVQDQPDHVELRVVADQNWGDSDRSAVEACVRGALGPRMRFDLSRVDDIPLTAAGKLRVVVNLCAAGPSSSSSPVAATVADHVN